MAKAKRMTQREKRERAEARARLRERGVLPPPKKPLNRKRFITDAKNDFHTTITGLVDMYYVVQAASWMTASLRPTLENVGAAKLLKLACEIKRFHEQVRERGDKHYNMEELYKHIEPILTA